MSDDLPAAARIALRLVQGERVSASGLSRKTKALFNQLIVSGVLKLDGNKRGEVYVVVHPSHLTDWVKQNFPSASGAWTAESPGAKNLLYSRDTKARRRRNRTLALLLRGWNGARVIRNGSTIPVADLTAVAGAAAIALGPGDSVEFDGPCAVVENPELFWQAGPECGIVEPLVLFKDGRAPKQMLAWMRTCSRANFVLHVDFDPVGLDEYRRIRAALGERVTLYRPANLGDLFANFGNRKILTKRRNIALLTSLRTETDGEIQSVLALIDQHACVVEQEALLVARLDLGRNGQQSSTP